MSPGNYRLVSYDIVVDSWESLHEVRANIKAVRGESGIVDRDERRRMLERLDEPASERVFRHRMEVPAEIGLPQLPRDWIDLVLEVEYGESLTGR